MPSLFICRREKDYPLIGEVSAAKGAGILVATDDFRVQRMASMDARVKEVLPIEQMESMLTVASDFLRVRESVNALLTGLHPRLPDYLLEWIKWAEGGDTTQRIQDALLLVRSYKILLSREIREIVLPRSLEARWEDDILLETARAEGVAVREARSFRYRLGAALGFYAVRRKILGKERLAYLPGSVIAPLKVLSLLWRIIRCKLSASGRSKADHEPGKVVFLLASSADKHVANAAVVMREFDRRNGYHAAALCWGAPGGCGKIKAMRLEAGNIEVWVTPEDAIASVRNYREVLRRFRDEESRFADAMPLVHQGVPLGRTLLPYVRKFLATDFLSRLVLYRAAKRYLEGNTPIALRTWGENILEPGIIFHELLNEGKSAGGKRNTLVFDYSVGINLPLPYDNTERRPDIVMLIGEKDREIYENNRGESKHACVVGFGRDRPMRDFRDRFTAVASAEALGVRGGKYNFFYIPSGCLRGYVSSKEHMSMATCLIEFAMASPDTVLVVKPHPAESELFWQDLLDHYRHPANVHLIDKRESAYHCINVSDVVITKFSTLALEAMEFGKVVVSVVLDREKRFQEIYGGAAETFTDSDSLASFLRNITSTEEVFEPWKRDRLGIQDAIRPKLLPQVDVPVEQVIVDKVVQSLGERMAV